MKKLISIIILGIFLTVGAYAQENVIEFEKTYSFDKEVYSNELKINTPEKTFVNFEINATTDYEDYEADAVFSLGKVFVRYNFENINREFNDSFDIGIAFEI